MEAKKRKRIKRSISHRNGGAVLQCGKRILLLMNMDEIRWACKPTGMYNGARREFAQDELHPLAGPVSMQMARRFKSNSTKTTDKPGRA